MSKDITPEQQARILAGMRKLGAAMKKAGCSMQSCATNLEIARLECVELNNPEKAAVSLAAAQAFLRRLLVR